MNTVRQADYSGELLTYKLKMLEIQQSVRQLDDSVNEQLNAVAGNLGIVSHKAEIAVPASIPADAGGFVRRMYRRVNHVKVIRTCADRMKKIKNWMQQYKVFQPVIKLVGKICR